jgi:hypothetical protein
MSKLLQFIEIDTPAWVAGSPIGPDITWRFAMPTEYLPADTDAIASVTGITYSAATISLGQDLGQRASLTVTFKDHKHILGSESFDSGTFWGKFRARYGQKLRGRDIRLIRGFVGQALADMETRHFFIDTVDGPTPDGTYTVVAKDLLKFADDDRAQAPRLSGGSLAGSLNTSVTAATLSPTGIGDSEYPASGHLCLGGKEIVSFTRSGDSLTITRAQLNTVAIAHDAGERAQLVLYYDGDDAADIINDLLTTYGGISSACIPLSDWQAETDAHLSVLYARAITEPTAVSKLVAELVEQAALAVWYDELARLVRLQVLKEIATDAMVIDEETILENSLKTKEQPEKRISQIWVLYNQRNPTDRADNEDNYRFAWSDIDPVREDEYGSPIFRKITAGWVPTESAADRLAQIQMSRFRDPPRTFNFDLFQGAAIVAGSGYRLRWRQNQNTDGSIVEEGAPIQVTRVSVEGGTIHVQAEEMLASGTVVVTNVVILTTAGSLQSWTVADDWNDADNSIHVIGGGGGGGGHIGGGGGGGAYSSISNLNLTPGGSVSYQIGTGGTAGSVIFGGTSGGGGGDSWFNGASLGASSVGAKGGSGGAPNFANSAAAGGASGSGIGTVKTSGGAGGRAGTGGDDRDEGGAGGGGAGGPNGNGGRGGNGSGNHNGTGGGGGNGGSAGGDTSGTSTAGGANRFGFGGGAAGAPGATGLESGGGGGSDVGQIGGPGGTGEQLWTQTIAPIVSAGPGGGAGGGGRAAKGAAGGLYGGAGSGGGAGGGGGGGAQGCIVIMWKPAA